MLKAMAMLILLTVAASAQERVAPQSHLNRVEQFDQENLWTDQQRMTLIAVIKARMLEQGHLEPTQETLLVKLERNMAMNMAELTALAGIITTSHNDEALMLRDDIFAKVRAMRGERDRIGYPAMKRDKEEYLRNLQLRQNAEEASKPTNQREQAEEAERAMAPK